MSASVTADYGPSWYATTMVEAPSRPPLTLDLDVDVCVVGGGLAGLTAAREIARRGWSVAVLEAKRVAWNASGRNCGFVLPGFAQSMDRIIDRVGRDHAKSLWALSQAGVDYVRETIRATVMQGVEPVDGWLEVAKTDNAEALHAEADLLGELGVDVDVWSTGDVRAALRSASYFGALHYPRAFHIHALNYALGLAAAIEQQGVRIFEDTPALAIDPAGVRKRVVTPSARVRAGHIVLAGNVHLGGLAARATGTLIPITTYVAVTAPLGNRLAEAISYPGAVSDTRFADNHYRIVGGDRLMWAGGLSAWSANSKTFVSQLRRDLGRVYPQLADVFFEFMWSGTMGHTVHRMPQIGEVSPGLWLASGFGGHGLNTTAMAGDLIASAVVDGDDRWKLFLPYPLVWGGGTLGRAAIQIAYWSYRKEHEARLKRRRRRDTLAQVRAAQAPAHKEGSSVTSSEAQRSRNAAPSTAGGGM